MRVPVMKYYLLRAKIRYSQAGKSFRDSKTQHLIIYLGLYN